jgi:hypothetical protein
VDPVALIALDALGMEPKNFYHGGLVSAATNVDGEALLARPTVELGGRAA